MSTDPIKTYQDAQRGTMTPREVEAMALTKAANLLEEAKGQMENRDALSQALRFNHLLWTIIQADIVEPENLLPDEIKANVMSLSIFVDKQTIKALKARQPDLLDALININRNLAAGLRTVPAP